MTEQRRRQTARYNASEARRAATARYYASAKGQAARARSMAAVNPRRIHVGRRYMGTAATADDALAIKAHIRERVQDFRARQRAEAPCR